MGLDVARLVIATNSNDIMARALNQGVYESGPSHATLSPSMDIQVASNFERALFEACDRDADWTGRRDERFRPRQAPGHPARSAGKLRSRYSAFACDDAETLATIARVHGETGRILDPHTAVAVHAAGDVTPPGTPTVILSTAHPAKFPDAVTKAIGSPPPVPPRLAGLAALPEKLDNLAPDATLLKQFICL